MKHKFVIPTGTDETQAFRAHGSYHKWLHESQGGALADINFNEPGNYFAQRFTDWATHANWDICLNKYLIHTNVQYSVEEMPSDKDLRGPFPLGRVPFLPVRYFLSTLRSIMVTCGDGFELITGFSAGNPKMSEHIIFIEDDDLALQFRLAFS